jgi:hypothetical protein
LRSSAWWACTPRSAPATVVLVVDNVPFEPGHTSSSERLLSFRYSSNFSRNRLDVFLSKSYRVERHGLLRRISISNFWRTEVYSCHSFKPMLPMVKRCWLDCPEGILEQAPGNRSDGFRSCLTRSASSSVARPENCRPTLARWIIEGLPVVRPQSRIWPGHSRANTTGHFRNNPAPPAVISGL